MNKTRNLFRIIVLLLPAIIVQAQQPAQYSLYMLNNYGTNPAAAGFSSSLLVNAAYRTQWVGITGNPTTQYINATLPLNIIGSGVGFAFENENIGARSGFTGKISFNKLAKLNNGQISFGISAGVVQGLIDGSLLRTPDGDYTQGIIDHKDNLLSGVSISGITPTIGAGVFYKNDKWEMGLAIHNLSETPLKLTGQTNINVSLKRYYVFTAGADVFSFKDIVIHPSVLVKSDITQIQADFSVLFNYLDNIFLGVSFRGYTKNAQDALIGMLGIKLSSQIKVAYAYDYTLSSLNVVSQGSHEIVLQYNLGRPIGKGKLPPIIYNPRF